MEMTQVGSMTFIVKVDGKEIPIPEEIGANDAAIRAALSPFYPGASNADLKRTVNGTTTTIDVVKRAGKLGLAPILNLLDRAPDYKDPAVELAMSLNDNLANLLAVSPDQIAAYTDAVEPAINASENCHKAVDRVYTRLCGSTAKPATTRVAGF